MQWQHGSPGRAKKNAREFIRWLVTHFECEVQDEYKTDFTDVVRTKGVDGLYQMPLPPGLPEDYATLEYLESKRQSATPQSLKNFIGIIKDSPNFNGDLEKWQKEQRNEWR